MRTSPPLLDSAAACWPLVRRDKDNRLFVHSLVFTLAVGGIVCAAGSFRPGYDAFRIVAVLALLPVLTILVSQWRSRQRKLKRNRRTWAAEGAYWGR